MSIRLNFNPRLSEIEQQLVKDYWSFKNKGGYINHVKALSAQYSVTYHELFRVIEKCFVCLDDVCCENCGCYCPIEVPADIPFMRFKSFWFCEECVRFSRGQVLIGRYPLCQDSCHP